MTEQAELGIICVECGCGRRTWLRDSEINFTPPERLVGRLRCQGCGSRDVSLLRPWKAALNDPLFGEATFKIEVWNDAGMRLEELVATSSGSIVAHAAYDAALIARPNRYITLRQRARVLRKSRDG
ncbi:hypothetical protein [Ancylobacter rudongensis]|uniref:Uncharacterized protein n=1 Tax=Ancylobacter rudongensis TaxID=177413 RepID=A0A1G4UQE4_9HYPH|nr:hypothetical protein [Ancylobacter rudongensis]SCW95881.1 hypothetical protein SAMN05660859_0139 [Ancylobacter rudongensis]